MNVFRKAASILVIASVLAAFWAIGAPSGRALAAGLCVGGSGCYSSIQAAVNAAAAGDTITVNPGTYTEQVTVTKALTLHGAGAGSSIIDATSSSPSRGIDVKGTSGVTISGFTVENANNEGILVEDSSNVTVTLNTLINNDKGLQLNPGSASGPSCAGASPFDQDDCGEAVHLRGVSSSTVSFNSVNNNAGGILLTDETGATHDNVIDGNRVGKNIYDCGITVPSHPSQVIPPSSPSGQPTFVPGYGIYNNMITNNLVYGNGVTGPGGAGIGVFAFVPGSHVTNNTIDSNTVFDNGLAGVTFHSHAPGVNLNENTITNNLIGNNNMTPGDAGDKQTTGILMFGAFTPIVGTVLAGNTIWANYYGVWTAGVQFGKLSGHNSVSATVPYFSEPASALPAGA